MSSFWLGTWALAEPLAPTGRSAEPITAQGADVLALEVIRDGPQIRVLFSSADDVDNPHALCCRIGFCNDAQACNSWRAAGFPMIDAAIALNAGMLRITSPFFESVEYMTYDADLITIANLDLDAAGIEQDAPICAYRQVQQTPDPGWPSTRIVQTPACYAAGRSHVRHVAGMQLVFGGPATRWPSLVPLSPGPQQVQMHHVWCGELAPLEKIDKPDPTLTPWQPVGGSVHPKATRADIFGEPVFRFEDVQAYGFRIELPAADPDVVQGLKRLIAPLNFHKSPAYAQRNPPTFRYEPATSVVLVELLRYGRMQLDRAQPPLGNTDYQSQHELVVRVLVAKADSHLALARDSAVYVPAIFVDNPWSKVVGRDMQGYAKCMAGFCIGDSMPLRPDGVRSGGAPMPLSAITNIDLVDTTRRVDDPSQRQPLLGLSYARDDGVELQLRKMTTLRALVNKTGALWRDGDFSEYEFANPMTSDAVWRSLNGFRSVQVSPVDDSPDPARCWIETVFTVDNLKAASPSGGASLVFHHLRDAPQGWRCLCTLLGIHEGNAQRLNFQARNWYQLTFSMGLRALH